MLMTERLSTARWFPLKGDSVRVEALAALVMSGAGEPCHWAKWSNSRRPVIALLVQ
jgi:hypothetical protein